MGVLLQFRVSHAYLDERGGCMQILPRWLNPAISRIIPSRLTFMMVTVLRQVARRRLLKRPHAIYMHGDRRLAGPCSLHNDGAPSVHLLPVRRSKEARRYVHACATTKTACHHTHRSSGGCSPCRPSSTATVFHHCYHYLLQRHIMRKHPSTCVRANMLYALPN